MKREALWIERNLENPMKNPLIAKKVSETKKQLYKEGKIKIWNKELTKETDERVRKNGMEGSLTKKGITLNMRFGKEKASDIKRKMSISHKGKHHNSLEQRKQISERFKKMWQNPIYYEYFVNLFKQRKHNEVTREHISQILKERYRDKTKHPFYNKKHSEKTKLKMSESASKARKLQWQNTEYREKAIKNILKGLMKRPTSLEKEFIEFINKHQLPFKYCGDGTLLIGFKNPDFVENNGKKLCIEVANKVKAHHSENYEQQRIEHFTRYGWKCLVLFFERDEKHKWITNESDLLKEVSDFVNKNQ